VSRRLLKSASVAPRGAPLTRGVGQTESSRRTGEPKQMPKRLEVHPEVVGHPDAVEVLRAWVSRGQFHVSLRHDAWSDPAAWGIALADLARHVARAHASSEVTVHVVLSRIREGLDAELDSPTDEPTGHFLA
jgi:uncharacterized protein DUF5076